MIDKGAVFLAEFLLTDEGSTPGSFEDGLGETYVRCGALAQS